MPTIVVAGRDERVTSRNKIHAEEKIAKLERYFDGIEKIEAVIGHTGDDAVVELIISVRRAKPIICQSQSKDLYAAIDKVIDKAEAQLTKFKERRKAHKGEKDRTDGMGPASAVTDEPLETYDEVIDKRDFS
jgi:putative sigma-54 modulation protein